MNPSFHTLRLSASPSVPTNPEGRALVMPMLWRVVVVTMLLWCGIAPAWAQTPAYSPLDAQDPVSFAGTTVTYAGQPYVLGPKMLYVDGQLSDDEAARWPYVYNNFPDAVAAATAGTPDEPMTILLAPWVYWCDDPDDPEVRRPAPGRNVPFALTVDCPYLRLYGLTQRPENVVLAVNRGQAQGSYGNFTLMDYHGDGLQLYNLTVGNYCNIDLTYPLRPAMNRRRRMDSITQAQLIFATGDRNEAHNCQFLSRLNLNPIFGAQRTLFDRCYFEMTDDSLCKSGVYLGCRFGFFSQFPFGSAQPIGGAVFMDCDIDVWSRDEQHLVKVCRGPFTLVDVRYHSQEPVYLGWSRDLIPERMFYQAGVTHNGQPTLIESRHPEYTVQMEGLPLLEAYRVTDPATGEVIYNTYNLLGGYDDWDPMGIRPRILALEQQLGRPLHGLPVYLALESEADTLEAQHPGRTVRAVARRHSDFDAPMPDLQWHADAALLQLDGQGSERLVSAVTQRDTTATTLLHVTTAYGLQARRRMAARPHQDAAPSWAEPLHVELDARRHEARAAYRLDMPEGRRDASLVRWFRCSSPQGDDAVLVAVTRGDTPMTTYPLTPADQGHYLMAEVTPRHNVSHAGTPVSAVTATAVTRRHTPKTQTTLHLDMAHFPTEPQKVVAPGLWTVDGYKPADTEYYQWTPADQCWTYDYGLNGAREALGLWQVARGARMMFTPVEGRYGDMALTLHCAPAKTSAQGFSSPTGQYMDLCIKFDTRTLTGYGLRIIRTTKYHNAVDFLLVRYQDGQVTPLTDPVSAVCFMTDCEIRLATHGRQLTAHVTTTFDTSRVVAPDVAESADKATAEGTQAPAAVAPLASEVRLSATMEEATTLGGFALQHTGSGRSGATVLTDLLIEWR